jgi:HD superfamily phosphohydrolase
MIRLAGVLHDIGHGPFSHTYEPILQKNRKATHEDLTEWLIKTSEVGDILENHGISKNEMALLARGRLPPSIPKWVPQIISGAWDVDKMDFLRRDSHYTGAEYGLIDVFRIIFSTDVINDSLMLDSTALYALEALLIARYEMFKAVYYHKTVRAAEIMMVSAMELANSELELTSFETPNQFLELDDGFVFTGLKKLKGNKDPQLKMAYQISENFHNRKLLKLAGEKILHVPDKFTAALYTKPSVKEDLEYEIANAAGVDPENVFIDIPTLPSIPYNPQALDPQELPLFQVENNERIPIAADRISKLITVLRGFMDVIRCFTWESYRKEVGMAAKEVFGALPQSANISF